MAADQGDYFSLTDIPHYNKFSISFISQLRIFTKINDQCDDDDIITDHNLVISSGTDIVKILIKGMDGEFPVPVSKPEFDEP